MNSASDVNRQRRWIVAIAFTMCLVMATERVVTIEWSFAYCNDPQDGPACRRRQVLESGCSAGSIAGTLDDLWADGLGTGTDALAWLSGDMDGDGRTDVIHPWSHNGTLGMHVYRSTGTGYATAFASSNMGAGSPAMAWRTGDADGDGVPTSSSCGTTAAGLGELAGDEIHGTDH